MNTYIYILWLHQLSCQYSMGLAHSGSSQICDNSDILLGNCLLSCVCVCVCVCDQGKTGGFSYMTEQAAVILGYSLNPRHAYNTDCYIYFVPTYLGLPETWFNVVHFPQGQPWWTGEHCRHTYVAMNHFYTASVIFIQLALELQQ